MLESIASLSLKLAETFWRKTQQRVLLFDSDNPEKTINQLTFSAQWNLMDENLEEIRKAEADIIRAKTLLVLESQFNYRKPNSKNFETIYVDDTMEIIRDLSNMKTPCPILTVIKREPRVPGPYEHDYYLYVDGKLVAITYCLINCLVYWELKGAQ